MDRFARITLGYHGCDLGFAEDLICGRLPVSDWKPSRHAYDWLGEGIYFWEYGPERARSWSTGGVVGAVIQLGRCLDLTDLEHMDALRDHYEMLRQSFSVWGFELPSNRGPQGKFRELDALVINEFIASMDFTGGYHFQTARGLFLEGEPIYPGSGILRESHVQIAVRDPACILGVFRPNLV